MNSHEKLQKSCFNVITKAKNKKTSNQKNLEVIMRCEQKTAGVMSETGSYKIDYMEN